MKFHGHNPSSFLIINIIMVGGGILLPPFFMAKILNLEYLRQKCPIEEEDSEFGILMFKMPYLGRWIWKLRCFGQNVPFRLRILSLGCLAPKCPNNGENPKFLLLRSKMSHLGRNS